MDINSMHDNDSQFPTAIRTILEAMYAQLFKGDFGVSTCGTVHSDYFFSFLSLLRKYCLAQHESLNDLVPFS